MSLITLALIAALQPPSAQHEEECLSLEKTAAALSERERGPTFAAAGDACRRAFEAVVENDAQAFGRRSFLVFQAHGLYLRAQAAGGADRPLCRDADMLRAYAAQLGTLPSDDRPRDRADVKRALEQASSGCPPESPPTSGASSPPARAEERPPAPQPEQDPAPVRTPPAPVADVAAPNPDERPRRPLRVAGGATLAAGLGLGGTAIGFIVRSLALRSQVRSLNEQYGEGPIPPGSAPPPGAGERADKLAIGLGVPAALLFAAGVTLLAVDAKHARNDRNLAILPTLGGVQVSMGF